jgi:Condensation domain
MRVKAQIETEIRSYPYRPEGFLRELGAFEEFIWLYTLSGLHRGFSMAIEVEGATTVEQWRDALEKVQKSQPLFSACIQKDEDENTRPFFRSVVCGPIPLRVVDGAAGSSFEREIATEVFTSFDGKHAPLLRAVLIHQPQHSVFILTAHHCIADGISMVFALRDLLRALSEESIEPLPLLPSQEESFRITRSSLRENPPADSPSLPPPLPGPPVTVLQASEPPRVESLQLDATLTRAIIDHARKERTTVNSAVCAALNEAARTLHRSWKERPIRIMTNINTRNVADVGHASAMYFTSSVLLGSAESKPSFWESARSFSQSLSPARSIEALQAGAQLITSAVVRGLDIGGIIYFLKHGVAHEIDFSNLGSFSFSDIFGALRLRSIWGSSFLTGVVDGQNVGVTTFQERLNLLYTTHTPIPRFLETVADILRQNAKP